MFAGILSAAIAVALLFAVVAATFGGILEAIVGSASSPMRTTEASITFAPNEWQAGDANSSLGRAVTLARTRVGLPYIWGATGPTAFDCSGLVVWVYQQLGLSVPRTADQQFLWAKPVDLAAMQPGDLVFYEICCQPPYRVTHVGVYVGYGQMIHAPAPGEFIRQESINTPYWRQHLVGFGRVLHPEASR